MSIPIDTRSILSGFFRHIRLFLLIFIPLNVMGIIYLLFVTPTYESTAKLLVKFGQEARSEIALSQNSGDGTSSVDEHREMVQSNIRIMTSRDLANRLLQEITLERAYPKIAQQEPAHGTPMDLAISRFMDNLSVKTESDAATISVGFFHENPEVASEILHRLVDLFIERQSEIYGNPQTDVLKAQADEAGRKLENARKAFYDYKSDVGVASIDEELSLLLKQRNDISQYLTQHDVTPSKIQKHSESESGDQNINRVGEEAVHSISGENSRMLEDVQQKIDELSSREAELLQTYQPDSDLIKNLRMNIAAQKAAKAHAVSSLEEKQKMLDVQIATKAQVKSRYEDLSREFQLDEDNYKAAQMRVQEAESFQDLNLKKITHISVIYHPTLPYKPAKPWKAAVMVLCLFLGLVFGLAACVGAEIFDQTFSVPEQVSRDLGIPVLADLAYQHIPPFKSLKGGHFIQVVET